MSDQHKPFCPSWLDDLGLKPSVFRVYLHLCRRAGKDGRCYPSATAIAGVCLINRKTVWPALDELEKAGLVVKGKKGFGQANTYTLTFPTREKEAPIEAESNRAENGPIDSLQSSQMDTLLNGSQSSQMDTLQSSQMDTLQSSQMGHLKGTPSKVIQKKGIQKNIIGEIYSAYPRKVGKPPALKAIGKALKKIDGGELLAIVKSYAAAIGWKEPQYIPHPSTWFNQERWADDPKEWKEPTTGQPQQSAPMSFGLRKPAGQKFIRETIGCENYTDDLPTLTRLPT